MVYVLHTHPRKLNETIDGMIFTDGIAATRSQNLAYDHHRKYGHALSVFTDNELLTLLDSRGLEFKHKFRMSHEG